MKNALLFVACVLIWGTVWYAVTFQLGVVPVEWSLAYRLAIASVLLFGFCFVTGKPLKFPGDVHVRFFGVGALLFSVTYFMIYTGTMTLHSGLVAVVFATLPLMNILNGALFLKRRLDFRVILTSLVGLIGISLIFTSEIEEFTLGDKSLLALLVVFLGVWFSSAGQTVASTKKLADIPQAATNAWAMAYGTLFMGALAFATGKPLAFDPGMGYVLSLLYLAAVHSALGFMLYLMLVKRITMERAAYFTVVYPLIALTISTLYEGYQWTVLAVVGLGLVLGGNVFILQTRKK